MREVVFDVMWIFVPRFKFLLFALYMWGLFTYIAIVFFKNSQSCKEWRKKKAPVGDAFLIIVLWLMLAAFGIECTLIAGLYNFDDKQYRD